MSGITGPVNSSIFLTGKALLRVSAYRRETRGLVLPVIVPSIRPPYYRWKNA